MFTSLILTLRYNFNSVFLSRIGLISYSWYLIHNSVGIIVIREINKLGFENLSVILAILFTLSISIISFKFVEIPIKQIILNIYKVSFKK